MYLYMYMHSVRKKLTNFTSEKLNGAWLSLYMENIVIRGHVRDD